MQSKSKSMLLQRLCSPSPVAIPFFCTADEVDSFSFKYASLNHFACLLQSTQQKLDFGSIDLFDEHTVFQQVSQERSLRTKLQIAIRPTINSIAYIQSVRTVTLLLSGEVARVFQKNGF